MKKKYLRYGLMIIFIMCAFALIVSCGPVGGGLDEDEETTPEEPGEIAAAASISLATSQASVQSDNSDSATITASVLDANNAVIEGLPVTFSADGGQISASLVATDENGQAQISFSSGTVDQTNRIAIITAEVAGLDPVQIPIQVIGTTIKLSTDNTNITVGASPAILTILVQDASLVPVYNTEVTLSVAPAGVATLSKDTGYTNVIGELTVTVTGTGAGTATVTAQAMGATATQAYTVGVVGAVFGITSPLQDPYSLPTNTDLPITVAAPGGITEVQFATTFGTLTGTDPVVSGQVIVQNVSFLGFAEAVLNSPTAGVATVQVFDANNLSTMDSLTVAISAPPSEASQIALQASFTVVAPSTWGISNTVTLTATVRNADNYVVGGAPVAFSIQNPTGGGETIYPVIALTEDSGVATSTFTSGSLSSGAEGVTVWAGVVGMPAVMDSISIVIGGTAGSVVIGRSTQVSSNATGTAYSLPMSVLVADSNGNPVSGAIVSLSAWPTNYYTGYTGDEDGPVVTGGPYANEDLNRNLTLDPGEDTGVDPGHGNGELTPPSPASGALPATVTTDDYGLASFDLVYLKASAVWIDTEIKASTLVLGTETSSTLEFNLPYAVPDKIYLPDSPYGIGTLTITASAGDGGSIFPSGAVPVDFLSVQTFTITPDAGCDVLDVEVDGVSVGAVPVYTFTSVMENHTITATFETTITASAGANGSISPSGTVWVNCNSDQTFTITPDAGFFVDDVLVDGVSELPAPLAIDEVYEYPFTNVTESHTISATFGP